MTLKVDTSRLHLQRRKNAEFNTLNETAAAPCLRTTVAYLLRGAASFRVLFRAAWNFKKGGLRPTKQWPFFDIYYKIAFFRGNF